MRIKILALLALTTSIPALAQSITVTTGIKSENHRPNGGVIISRDPVAVLDARITDNSGLYGRIWSTIGNRRDTEVRLSAGITKSCLGGLTCRAELGYWATPTLSRSTGDIVAFSGEVSGRQNLSDHDIIGFSTQAEYLRVRGRPDTQILRADVNYTHSVGNVPVRLQAGYAYNVRPDWSHLPLSLSAAVPLRRNLTLTPSIEALIPISQRQSRRDGIVFGITLTYRTQ